MKFSQIYVKNCYTQRADYSVSKIQNWKLIVKTEGKRHLTANFRIKIWTHLKLSEITSKSHNSAELSQIPSKTWKEMLPEMFLNNSNFFCKNANMATKIDHLLSLFLKWRLHLKINGLTRPIFHAKLHLISFVGVIFLLGIKVLWAAIQEVPVSNLMLF